MLLNKMPHKSNISWQSPVKSGWSLISLCCFDPTIIISSHTTIHLQESIQMKIVMRDNPTLLFRHRLKYRSSMCIVVLCVMYVYCCSMRYACLLLFYALCMFIVVLCVMYVYCCSMCYVRLLSEQIQHKIEISYTPNTPIHDRSLRWLWTCTSIIKKKWLG